jgi:hypothetical protein
LVFLSLAIALRCGHANALKRPPSVDGDMRTGLSRPPPWWRYSLQTQRLVRACTLTFPSLLFWPSTAVRRRAHLAAGIGLFPPPVHPIYSLRRTLRTCLEPFSLWGSRLHRISESAPQTSENRRWRMDSER